MLCLSRGERRSALPAVLVPLILLLGACDATEPNPPVPAGVRIAGDSVHLFVGEGAVVSATAVDARGNPIPGAPLSWSSSDPSVAEVDAAGHVLALRPGRAEITARAAGGSAPRAGIAVRVERRPDRLELPQDTFVLRAPGMACRESVAATLYDRSGKAVPPGYLPSGITFSLADTAIAGQIRPQWGTAQLYMTSLYGKRAGETRLIAATGQYADTAVVRVGPGTPTRPRITAVGGHLYDLRAPGDTLQLRGEVLNECAGVVEGMSAALSSGNPAVVEVDSAGRAIARAPGSTYLYATWNAQRDSASVSIR